MTLLLDPRDGSGDLQPYLNSIQPGCCELATLEAGDVMGVGNGPSGPIVWGIEVKKIGELLGALQSGRLVDQLGRMHEDYDWKFLLMEGGVRCGTEGQLQTSVRRVSREGKPYEFWCDAIFGRKQKISYVSFIEWVLSVCLCSGTFMLSATGREESASTIVALERLLAKPWDSHASLKVFNDSQSPGLFVPSVAMKVARDLAVGMGWERAARAADRFGTVRQMVNATEEEWREVEGIDKVLAQRVMEGVNESHVLRVRQRMEKEKGKEKEKRNGQTHGNVQASSGVDKATKRRANPGKVHRTHKG